MLYLILPCYWHWYQVIAYNYQMSEFTDYMDYPVTKTKILKLYIWNMTFCLDDPVDKLWSILLYIHLFTFSVVWHCQCQATFCEEGKSDKLCFLLVGKQSECKIYKSFIKPLLKKYKSENSLLISAFSNAKKEEEHFLVFLLFKYKKKVKLPYNIHIFLKLSIMKITK